MSRRRCEDLLVWVKDVLDLDALGSHGSGGGWSRSLASGGYRHSLTTLPGVSGDVAASESVHEPATVIGLEVDSSDIRVVKSRGTANATVVLAVSTVEDTTSTASVGATATSTAEGRALVGLSLLGECTEEVRGRFGGKLVVAETNADLAAGELETVHLCESILSVRGVNEPVMY